MSYSDTDDKFEDLLAESEQKELPQDVDFKSYFKDVKSLKQDTVTKVTPVLNKELARIRQEAAVTSKEEAAISEASSAFVHMVEPNEILSFRREGVQPYVLRKLKNGEYREADFIDLHGKTLEEAYQYVIRFVAHARREEFRCILIIHGKGTKAPKKALLKSYVAHWLRQLPEVLAFHSAPEWKGGTGSVMVILKKGDKTSAMNREMHARRF